MTTKLMESIQRHTASLEQDFLQLCKEHTKMIEIAAAQQEVLDLCPGSLPDGTGLFTPESWIRWAIKELRYTHDVDAGKNDQCLNQNES